MEEGCCYSVKDREREGESEEEQQSGGRAGGGRGGGSRVLEGSGSRPIGARHDIITPSACGVSLRAQANNHWARLGVCVCVYQSNEITQLV